MNGFPGQMWRRAGYALFSGGLTAAALLAAPAQAEPVADTVSVPGYVSARPSIILQGPTNQSRKREFERPLERLGVIDRNSPYRVSIPLATLGDNGEKLAFTYVPHMKNGNASRVFMLYFKMNLD